jgi:hypothetical protein
MLKNQDIKKPIEELKKVKDRCLFVNPNKPQKKG